MRKRACPTRCDCLAGRVPYPALPPYPRVPRSLASQVDFYTRCMAAYGSAGACGARCRCPAGCSCTCAQARQAIEAYALLPRRVTAQSTATTASHVPLAGCLPVHVFARARQLPRLCMRLGLTKLSCAGSGVLWYALLWGLMAQ